MALDQPHWTKQALLQWIKRPVRSWLRWGGLAHLWDGIYAIVAGGGSLFNRYDVIDRFARAEIALSKCGTNSDYVFCLKTYAMALHQEGFYYEAQEILDTAVTLCRQHNYERAWEVLHCRALNLSESGQRVQAKHYFREAIVAAVDAELRHELSWCLIGSALNLELLGELQEARAQLERALTLLENESDNERIQFIESCVDRIQTRLLFQNQDRATDESRNEGFSHNALTGHVELSAGLLALHRMQYFDRFAFGHNWRATETVRLQARHLSSSGHIGRAYALLHAHVEKLRSLWRNSNRLAERSQIAHSLSSCLLDYAVLSRNLGDFDTAQDALRETEDVLEDASVGVNSNPQRQYLAYLNAAFIVSAPTRIAMPNTGAEREYLENVLLYVDESVTISDSLLDSIDVSLDRIDAMASALPAYRLGASVSIQLRNTARSYWYAERGKGRVVAELINQSALARQQEMFENQVRKSITGPNRLRPGLVKSSRFHPRTSKFQERFSPATRNRRVERWDKVPTELSRVLVVGEVFIDAFTIEDDGSLILYLFHPGQPSVSWQGRVDGQALQALVDHWQEARAIWTNTSKAKAQILTSTDPVVIRRRDTLLAAADYDARMAAAFVTEQEVLGELGALIFGQVLNQLNDTVTTLIVSPDGLLHQVPLAAVVLPSTNGHSLPMFDRFDLQLVPTASSLVILRGRHGPRVTWPATLLAAAPFSLDDRDENDDDLPATDQRADIAVEMIARSETADYVSLPLTNAEKAHKSLPESGPEIMAIANCLTTAGCPPPIILQQSANRTRLESNLRAASILHLATHGGKLKPAESVLDYRIFLADRTEIQVREFYEERILLKDVFLVTLSACSLGEVMQQGAEALGFVQAFLQAGAGVVLAPLWEVDDRATKELMVRFYEELTAPDSPTVASAWRRACYRLRTETGYVHPIYWAGFLPSGDASIRLTA